MDDLVILRNYAIEQCRNCHPCLTCCFWCCRAACCLSPRRVCHAADSYQPRVDVHTSDHLLLLCFCRRERRYFVAREKVKAARIAAYKRQAIGPITTVVGDKGTCVATVGMGGVGKTSAPRGRGTTPIFDRHSKMVLFLP